MSDSTTRMRPATKSPRKPENIWLNLLCNIVVPVLVLTKLNGEDRLGPLGALVVGMAFPLGYGIYDLITRRKWNLFSIVGVVSVGLTGGLGLARASAFWIAVKEASVPLIFAVAVLATLRTRRPLVREIMLNDSVVDVPRMEAALAARGTRAEFEVLLRSSTWWLAGSFVLSAVLNFALARILLKSAPGTPEFTAELGRMTGYSMPVIIVPSFAIMVYTMWRLFAGLRRLTGLEMEDLLHSAARKKTPDSSEASRPSS